MKIITKILIFAICLTLFGGILFLVGCSGNGFDFSKLSSVQIKQMEYVEAEGKTLTNLSLNFNSTNFKVILDENAEKVSISYPQRQNKKGKDLSHIEITENETGIQIVEDRQKHFYLFDFTNPSVTLTLPKARVYALSLNASTGDINLSDEGSFSTLQLTVSTGSIAVSNVTATDLSLTASTGDIRLTDTTATGNITVQVSTGDISLTKITAATLSATASTGDVQLADATIAGEVKIKTTTGDISLAQISADSLSAKANTGDVKIDSLTIENAMKVETSTGSHTFLGSIKTNSLTLIADTGKIKAREALIDATTISITTDTGDVAMQLVGNKNDYATTVETDTGSKNISSNLENVLDGLISPTRTLKVKTDTGDIKVYFAEQN